MRFPPEASWGANAGLQKARDFLAPLAVKYKMSVADVWTLAGAVAVESMGGTNPILFNPNPLPIQAPLTLNLLTLTP